MWCDTLEVGGLPSGARHVAARDWRTLNMIRDRIYEGIYKPIFDSSPRTQSLASECLEDLVAAPVEEQRRWGDSYLEMISASGTPTERRFADNARFIANRPYVKEDHTNRIQRGALAVLAGMRGSGGPTLACYVARQNVSRAEDMVRYEQLLKKPNLSPSGHDGIEEALTNMASRPSWLLEFCTPESYRLPREGAPAPPTPSASKGHQ